MTRVSRLPLRWSLLLLGGVPLAVGLAVGTRDIARIARLDEVERTDRLGQAFERLLLDARAIADDALRGAGLDEPSVHRGALAPRLEGLAILDADLHVLEWRGAPTAPPANFGDPLAPGWTVRVDGLRTRMLVRAGPDGAGRLGLAVFVLDSTLDDERFLALLPPSLLRGIHLEVDFEPTGVAALDLRAPTGERLGVATIERLDARRLRAAAWGAAAALALCAFLLLLGVLVHWPLACATWPGAFAAVAAAAAGRAALLLVEAPARLLPPALGEAGAFGSPLGGGLIASPADLLLTGGAVYLICLAVRVRLDAAPAGRAAGTAAVAAACGSAAAALAFALVVPLARDSRLPLLERRALAFGDPRLVLVVGFALVLIGAAELWGALGLRALRRAGLGAASEWTRRVAVAACVAALALAASVALHAATTDLALERLREEFAPLTLEQASRRAVALTEALRHVADTYAGGHDRDLGDFAAQPEYLAFRFWTASALCAGGYKSSLDFYTPSGDRVSHFAFDLPRLDEPIEPALSPRAPAVHAEAYEPVVAVEESLLHAEIAVRRGEELVGVVVGHVLDEPTNLPFLPGSQPYLAALGAGPAGTSALGAGEPQYVLYDADGSVVLTTLRQPPADSPALRAAGGRRGVVRVRAGPEPHVGIALADGGRLHLLLVAEPGWLERLAAATRLVLAGLIVLGSIGLAARLARPAALAALVRRLPRSLYRKLLAALLAAAILPLAGLGLILRGYTERRGDAELIDAATRAASVAQRVLEDYLASRPDSEPALDDNILYWLRRVVGQEIHVYRSANLVATSKRELFASGLLPLRLDGEVQRSLSGGGLPYVVRTAALGTARVPVAYAPLRVTGARDLVVAVPVVLEPRQIVRAVDRVVEVILLASLVLVALLALTAAFVARTVARPVRELAQATARIAGGDYDTRLRPRTADEVADLVAGFNSMAGALSRQRADLERRREYIERLLRHATTGVLSTDAAGHLVTINPAARRLLEPAAAELDTGCDLGAVLRGHPSLARLAEFLGATAPAATQDADVERAGKPRRYRLERIELPEPEGPAGMLVLLDDVTEAARSSQLAAWAEMARAIAHEIKNPLTPIRLSADHLRRLLTDRGVLPSAEIEACLDTMLRQVHTLHEIAGEFSAYAKLPDLALEPLDPVALMRDVIAPYRGAPPAGVRIEESYAPAGRADVDRRVLSRALLNLVENALQAMPDGGTLVAVVARGPGAAEVTLAVSDTGPGLAPEVRRRLFEPYFSTKSSGTGLGLAIARQAVEGHRGRIEIDSAPGCGTTVRIVLPRLVE